MTAEMEDSEQNIGGGGVGDPTSDAATVFEIDNQLAGNTDTDATTDPAPESEVPYEDPFDIVLEWKAEANEYPGDSNSMVTLTSVELDGVDMLANAVRQDRYTYIVTIDEIGLGEHTLSYNAEDAAGNTNATPRTLTFTVGEAPTWSMQLRKGMNLVSLPSNPANGDINDVFAGASQVDLVFTFEEGRALVAVRNPGTGDFAGTLDMIDAQHAYWVSATNAVTVEVDIPATSQQTVLPSISVKGG